MSSRSERERDRQKALQEKCVVILDQLLRDEDNKYCVDCDAKGPRWASWNLGVFLCIRCAGIHRNLGVHVSRVKSVNLDSWTPDQVASLEHMGNSKGRAVYEARLPDNFRRPQMDSALEAFIRAKYEQKKYIAKEWVPPTSPPKAAWAHEPFALSPTPAVAEAKKKKKQSEEPKIVVKEETKKTPKPATTAQRQPVIPKSQSLIDDLLSLDMPPTQPIPAANAAVALDDLDLFTSAPTASSSITKLDGLQSPTLAPAASTSNQISGGNVMSGKLSKESILALYQTTPNPSYPAPGFQGGFPGAPLAIGTPAQPQMLPKPFPVGPTNMPFTQPAVGLGAPITNGSPVVGLGNPRTQLQQPAYSQQLLDQMRKLGMQDPTSMPKPSPVLGVSPFGAFGNQLNQTPQTGFANPWNVAHRPTGPASLPTPQSSMTQDNFGMFLGGAATPTATAAPTFGQTMSKSLWQ